MNSTRFWISLDNFYQHFKLLKIRNEYFFENYIQPLQYRQKPDVGNFDIIFPIITEENTFCVHKLTLI